jgi:EAL domain-containing protein (putative c-di-GMP-specific phosphodiesterase class I)
MKSQPAWNDPAAYMRHALAVGGFELYCQPIAALGGLVRAYPMGEVLVRLREEEQAMLPPGEFLPVLEHYGLMPRLDRWVLREALRRMAIGSRIARLCLNVSVQTIADPAFPAFAAEQFAATRVPANCVLFEIDENEAMAAPDCVARFAALAGSLGAGMVIDGFGRSGDALQLLEYVPCIRAVKLQGSFTRELVSRGKSGALLDRILRETRTRGIMAVAECVEEPEVLPRLKALGIRYAQGFGIYKPQPLSSFTEPLALLVT